MDQLNIRKLHNSRREKQFEESLYKSTLIRSASTSRMEEDESNEDIQSQPNRIDNPQPTPSNSTDSLTLQPDWPKTPFDNSEAIMNEISELKAQLSICQKQLEDKDDRIAELREHVTSLETDWTKDWNSFSKKRKFSNSKPVEEEDDELQKVKNEKPRAQETN